MWEEEVLCSVGVCYNGSHQPAGEKAETCVLPWLLLWICPFWPCSPESHWWSLQHGTTTNVWWPYHLAIPPPPQHLLWRGACFGEEPIAVEPSAAGLLETNRGNIWVFKSSSEDGEIGLSIISANIRGDGVIRLRYTNGWNFHLSLSEHFLDYVNLQCAGWPRFYWRYRACSLIHCLSSWF